MIARRAYQVGYFDGLEGFQEKVAIDGQIEISESVYFYLPLELEKYSQGHKHGTILRNLIDKEEA